jgi:hypothetical protein
MKKDDSENRRMSDGGNVHISRLGEMYLLSESLTVRRQLDIIGAAGDSTKLFKPTIQCRVQGLSAASMSRDNGLAPIS